jgi:hypothetical protein
VARSPITHIRRSLCVHFGREDQGAKRQRWPNPEGLGCIYKRGRRRLGSHKLRCDLANCVSHHDTTRVGHEPSAVCNGGTHESPRTHHQFHLLQSRSDQGHVRSLRRGMEAYCSGCGDEARVPPKQRRSSTPIVRSIPASVGRPTHQPGGRNTIPRPRAIRPTKSERNARNISVEKPVSRAHLSALPLMLLVRERFQPSPRRPERS